MPVTTWMGANYILDIRQRHRVLDCELRDLLEEVNRIAKDRYIVDLQRHEVKNWWGGLKRIEDHYQMYMIPRADNSMNYYDGSVEIQVMGCGTSKKTIMSFLFGFINCHEIYQGR